MNKATPISKTKAQKTGAVNSTTASNPWPVMAAKLTTASDANICKIRLLRGLPEPCQRPSQEKVRKSCPIAKLLRAPKTMVALIEFRHDRITITLRIMAEPFPKAKLKMFAVRVEAHDRKRLEQLCRYITRPALSDERVQLNCAGQVELKLKTPWRDGTTHLVMSPLRFMQRLAALVPRLRLHRCT